MNKSFYNRYHSHNSPHSKVKLVNRADFTYGKTIEVIEKHLKPGMQVLDVGCGVGTVDMFLAANHKIAIKGIDISSRAISIANHRASKLNLSEARFVECEIMEYLATDTNHYDLVICSEVIEHIENDTELIRLINARLRKGGFLVLSTPSLNAPLYRMGLLEGFDKRVGHIRRYTMQSVTKILKLEGMKIVEVYLAESLLRNSMYTFYMLGPLLRLVRGPVAKIVNTIDKLLVDIFGESDIYIVAKK